MLVLSESFTLGGLHTGERKLLGLMPISLQLLLKKFWEKMVLQSYMSVAIYASVLFENHIMIDPFELGLLIFRWHMVVQTLDFIMEQILVVQTRLTTNLISLHTIMLGIFQLSCLHLLLWNVVCTLQNWLSHMQDAPIREDGDVDNSKFNGMVIFSLIFRLSILYFSVCWLYFL